MKRLCVFGGTFDPPTKAHLSIVKALSKEFDTVLVVINQCNYYRRNPFMFTFETRHRILSSICKKHFSNVIVSDLEKNLTEQHTFIDTIRYIQNEYNDGYEIYTAIGGDSYSNFKTWKFWKEILKCTKLVVVPRKDEKYVEDDEVPHILMKVKIVNDGSATDYRKKLEKAIMRNAHI